MSDTGLPRDAKFARAANVVATRMDEEIVMMDVSKGAYFAISGSGPAIWEMLAEPILIEDLVAGLGEEFEAGPQDDLEEQVVRFLSNLVDKGLVEAVE